MNIAVILSGGSGIRIASSGSAVPKQYIKIEKKPIISYCIEQFSAHKKIDKIQIVAALNWQNQIQKWLKTADRQKKFNGFSIPGENRQLSILHALEDIIKYAEESDYVMIHDAARPLLTEKQITECLEAAAGHDGVLPVIPIKDTIYQSKNKTTIDSLLNREEFFAGQAPEVFRLGTYYQANKKLLPNQILEITGSTEAAIRSGMDIVLIPGDERNFKITTKADLEQFRCIIEKRIER